MTRNAEILLNIVQYGLGKDVKVGSLDNINELAVRQEVAAIALDGINRLYDGGVAVNLDFQTKMDWIGYAHQVEVRYRQQEEAMGSLAGFYQKHGIQLTILKGIGLSCNYPIPQHRMSSDIDIYLNGEQKRGDRLISEELGIKIDNSHHHTVFSYEGESIENHYDFLNVYVRRSNKRVEKKLKTIFGAVAVDSGSFYLPSSDFNAIFLLRHCASHFASTEMTIRQALDWGYFMEKHHQEITWDEYLPYLKEEGMHRFYNLLGLFCMKYLGFDASIFHGLYEDALLDRFTEETMSPEFKEYEDGTLLKSLSVKPRRWWYNRWKNRLCYPDSAWSEFAYGLWAKVLKPSHFIQ